MNIIRRKKSRKRELFKTQLDGFNILLEINFRFVMLISVGKIFDTAKRKLWRWQERKSKGKPGTEKSIKHQFLIY